MPESAEGSVIDLGFGTDGVVLPGSAADWMGVDGWIRGRSCIAPNAMGEHPLVLFAVLVLLIAISCGVAVAVLLAAVFTSSHLGSSPGIAQFEDEARLGAGAGTGDYRIDDSCVERRTRMGCTAIKFELGIELARVVPGGNRA